MDSSRAALDDVVVIDLSHGVAGPYCTRLLAGLGAVVIKIEDPVEGDVARRWEPLLAGPNDSLDRSALFHHLNANKRSVALNIGSPEGRDLLKQLIRNAQAVVENFAPGVVASLGIGYPVLAKENPSLVMTSITSFGQQGPYRDYVSTDLVELAMGGMLFTCGDPKRTPLKIGGMQAGYLAGLNAAVATLTALLRAETTGVGEWIDVSIIESVVSSLEATTVSYSRSGTIRRRQGNRHGRSYPMTILPCKDGYVGVMLGSDADWELFSQLAGAGELLEPRFKRGEDRFRFADEIDAILQPHLSRHTREELFHWAQELRLPFSIVLTPDELLNDPQHRARSFFTIVEHPIAGEVLQVGPPFRMEATPWQSARAPLLGEHTSQVLDEHLQKRARGEGASFAHSECPDAFPDIVPGYIGASFGQDDSRHFRVDGLPEGVRILDLTSVWAGPLCTRVLADLGAEVIKIESPTRPDGTRGNPGYFSWLNRGKLGVTLDLNFPPARDCFKRLVAHCDVVVENFSPRVMKNFQLDYPTLKEIKPDIIMLSMPAYGSSGPYQNYVAYGPGLEASSGLAALTGYSGGPPMLSGSAYGDPVAGLHGAVAVLAALRCRNRFGIGQWIDLSQREALSQMFGEAFVAAAKGENPRRLGNRHVSWTPHGCYRCLGRDRWIAIAVRSASEWTRLCQVMGKSWMVKDPRFADARSRKEHEDELDREIESWTSHQDCRDAMQALQKARIPAGVVMDASDLANDPHLAERGFFLRGVDAEGAECVFPGLPWKTLSTQSLPLGPAPRLGEHNSRVLGGLLGLSAEDIEELEKGIWSTRGMQ